jgi:hypothetical protein
MTRVRGGDDNPHVAVSMHGESMVDPDAANDCAVISYGPYVGRRDCIYTQEKVGASEGIRAWHDTPLGTIPVLNQCLLGTTGYTIPHRPNIISRDRFHIRKEIVSIGVRAWYDIPLRAVPALDQSEAPVNVAILANSPRIIARNRRNVRETIVSRARI